MFRSSTMLKCLMAAAILPACSARLHADVMFTDSFDTGYSSGDLVGSPWVHQVGAPVHVVEWAAGASSSPFLLGTNSVDAGSEPMISRPTGAGAADTSVVLSTYAFGELSQSNMALVLTPHADPGTNAWRGSDSVGSLSLFWFPSYGIESYYVKNDGTQVYMNDANVAKTGAGGKVDLRLSLPKASGAQTATIDWKLASDSTWTTLRTVELESGFSADYIGLRFGGPKGAIWMDDVSFHSVPEPSSITILAVGAVGLLAYAWRKRK